MFNLDAFIGANADFSRGYTFYATVRGPYMKPDDKYLVRSSRLPTSVTDQAELNWQGMKYKIGTTQSYSDFTISYQVDVRDDIRYAYETWMNRDIHNPTTNQHGIVGGFTGGYLGEVVLEHISHTDLERPIMTYKLRGAWPINIGELALDYSAKDVATFDVTFAYQYHTIDFITS